MKIKKRTLKQALFAVFLVVILAILISFGSNRKIKADIVETEEVEKMDYPVVVLETNMGNIEIELYEDKAPITVKNFLDYVNSGFYDGLIFHRVIDAFMIQGGGFDKDMNQKETKAPIKNEADNGLKNEKYTLAMARTGVVDSATSQFFINVMDNSALDHSASDFGYAVFGKVIGEGIDTVIKIKQVPTATKGMHQNVPVEPVVIEKAYVK